MLVLGCLFYLDSCWYGEFTIVPFKFLLFNFVNNFSEFYGQHPWHWYFSNGLPSLMGPTLLPLLSFSNFGKINIHQETKTMLRVIFVSCCFYILGHRSDKVTDRTFVGDIISIWIVYCLALSVTKKFDLWHPWSRFLIL